MRVCASLLFSSTLTSVILAGSMLAVSAETAKVNLHGNSQPTTILASATTGVTAVTRTSGSKAKNLLLADNQQSGKNPGHGFFTDQSPARDGVHRYVPKPVAGGGNKRSHVPPLVARRPLAPA
jgi:hypothetical protein